VLVNRTTGYYLRTMPRLDLCLDFANTRYYRGQAEPTETLNGPEDLAAWIAAQGHAKSAKALTGRDFDRLA
jgi:hypothetical protein